MILDRLKASILSVLNSRGEVVGAGFLTFEKRIVTCAHVVAQALDIPQDTPEKPAGEVRVNFPLVKKGKDAKQEAIPSRVVFWSPVSTPPRYGSDIAVLKPEGDLPEGSQPGRLLTVENLWKHPFRAFGFPPFYDNGVWARGVILDRLSNGWVEVEDVKQTGYFVEPGFSGTPVWDDQENGIVGMVVSSESQSHIRTAFIIPASLLIEVCPELARQPAPPCPYQGLFAFREEHAPFFFGREGFTQKLVEAVQKKSLVAVIGPSGSGKSSVVFAGLIPHLHNEPSWLITSFRPGERPFSSLASAIFPLMKGNMPERLSDQLDEKIKLAELIREKEDGFQEAVKEIRERNPAGSSMLLVADQFEELFTLCPKEEDRRCLLDRLLAATNIGPYKPRPDIRLVITLRADFLGHASSYRPFADALQEGALILGPMNRQELQAAIEKPAQTMNVRIEDGLTERILEAVDHAPGNLPLLEFTLTQMWKAQESGTLTHTTYDVIGGVERSIAHHADEVYNRLNEEERKGAQRIFIQLVRPGQGTEDTRRIATRSEIGEENWAIASRLADDRLVVTGQDKTTGEETLEIVHEALIRGWQRLCDWIEADRAFITWQEHLHAAIHQWEACNRDQGALLRGAPLVEAEDWLKKRQDDLGELDIHFIREGLALREHEQASSERRRRLITLGISSALVVALILASLVFLAWRRSERQRQIALARQLIAQSELTRNLQPNLLPCSVLLAVEAVQRLQKLGSVSMEADQALRRGLGLLPRSVACLNHDNHEVKLAAFSQDGEYLATASADHLIRIWQWKSNKDKTIASMAHDDSITTNAFSRLSDAVAITMDDMAHDDAINAIVFSPDGEYLASASEDNTARLWNVSTGKEIMRMEHEDHVTAIAFSPDGGCLATASADSNVCLWAIPGRKRTGHISHEDYVTDIAFSPNGEYLATASWDNTARVWKVEDAREVARMPHKEDVTAIAFSPDGNYLVTVSAGKIAWIWDIAKGQMIHNIIHDNLVMDTAFSPDGRYLAIACDDNTVWIWEKESRQVTHKDRLTALIFSPDSKYLATSSKDGTASLWDVTNGREVIRIAHKAAVNSIVFSTDGKYIATAGKDGIARIWQSASICKDNRMHHPAEVTSVAFSPNGDYLATASRDHTARIWKTETCQEVAHVRHEWPMKAIAFHPHEAYLATASGDHVVRLWEASSGKEAGRLSHHAGVYDLTFSPDGGYLATMATDGSITIWKVKSRRRIHSFSHEAGFTAMAFSNDGKYLATATKDRHICVRHVINKTQIACMRHTGEILAIALSPDGLYMAAAGDDGSARVWDTSNSREIATIRHDGAVIAVVFSPDGQSLATASRDGSTKLWDINKNQEIFQMRHTEEVTAIAFSPDGQSLATASKDRTARIWSTETGQEITRMEHSGEVVSVAFSPDGQSLATASKDRTARVWNAMTGQEISHMNHPGEVTTAIFHSDGSSIATMAHNDPYARIWDAASSSEISHLKHHWQVHTLEFSPDGKYLATASRDCTTRIWEIPCGKEITCIMHKGNINALAFNPNTDKGTIATAVKDELRARLWDAISSKNVFSLPHPWEVQALAFSQDGDYMATACRDHMVRIWDVSTGKEIISIPHEENIKAITFSPDGDYIVTACGDRTARLWEVSTGREHLRLRHKLNVNEKDAKDPNKNPTLSVDDVAFSPNGKYLATLSITGMAWIWDIKTGQELARINHEDLLNAIAFSPDGEYLATASDDHTARVWKASTGQEIARIPHGLGINDVAFSPDGRYLITACSDQSAQKWIWRPEDMIKEACSRLTRNLTKEEWNKYLGDEPYRKTCP